MKNFFHFLKVTFAGSPRTTKESDFPTRDVGTFEKSLFSEDVFDSMSTHVCILNARTEILTTNKAWNAFQGARQGGLPLLFSGVNFSKACSGDEKNLESAYRTLASGLTALLSGSIKEFTTQLRFTVSTGPLWFLCKAVRIPTGNETRLLLMMDDISELKKAQEELLLKSIAIERANDGIVLTDTTQPDNPIVYVSQGFLKLTGYSEEEVLGRNCRFMQGPDSDPAVIRKMREAIANEQPFVGEIINYTKSGKAWHNHLKLEPVRDANGKLIRYVGVQMDVSSVHQHESERRMALEREKSARKEMERLYQEAQQANGIKDDFLATLSHELRTPAGVISGFTELLKYETLAENERSEALDALERNARALVTLMDDLLDMNRVITGKLKLNPKPLDLTSIVESVISAELLAAQTKNIRVVTEFDPAVGPIYGDTTRLQQIFWNLLSNAIKFTPRNGRVKVSLKMEGTRVVVRVSDTGVGIESQFLPHVFERFRQQDSSLARSYGGLGLGLSIVKHLVELHGGAVTAESPGPGRGSTFSVSFPALTYAG